MKKIVFMIVLTTTQITTIFSQDCIKYQAVLRDSLQQPMINSYQDVRFTVFSDVSYTIALYRELFTTVTDTLGLINLCIGTGNSDIGDFNNVDWSQNILLRVEMREQSGNFRIISENTFCYVPKSFYSERVNPLNRTVAYRVTNSELCHGDKNIVLTTPSSYNDTNRVVLHNFRFSSGIVTARIDVLADIVGNQLLITDDVNQNFSWTLSGFGTLDSEGYITSITTNYLSIDQTVPITCTFNLQRL